MGSIRKISGRYDQLNQELTEAFASIFYNLDKSNILDEYLGRVDKVVEVLQKNLALKLK